MTTFDSIIFGDESLTQYCAETLLSQGHRISAFVTANTDLSDWAKSQNIRVERFDSSLADRLAGVASDWIFSIANLNILSPEILRCATKGAVNFHDGPLPGKAGLNAPVWSLLQGEKTHCVTWHLIEEGVDTGDILLERGFDIGPDDTALTLNTKCYETGLTSFPDVLTELANGLPNRRKQDENMRSYFGRTDRPEANGLIRFDQPAGDVQRLVRALDHGPFWNPLCTAKMLIGEKLVNVGRAERMTGSAEAGTVLDVTDDSLTVATKDAAVKLSKLKDGFGKPVDPGILVSKGEIMPAWTDAERSEITRCAQDLAKQDAHWRKALGQLSPMALPLRSKSSGGVLSDPTAIRPEYLNPALAVFAAGLSANEKPVLAFADVKLHDAATLGIANLWVPVATDALRTDQPMPEIGFARDLLLRDPALMAVETPLFGLSHGAGHIPGTALTFELVDNEVFAHINTAVIPHDYALTLIRRVQWAADQLKSGTADKDIARLSPSEREDVLFWYNDTAVDVPVTETMHAAFEAQVLQTPDAIALVFEASEFTFAELNKRANQLAHTLRDMAVKPDIMVGLHCQRGPNLVIGALGILKAGGAYLPLDPEYPADRLTHYLTDSAAPVVISEQAIAADLPDTGAERLIIDGDPRFAKANTDNPACSSNAENLAYVIYTSGSTGVPKGVMIEHRNAMNFYAGMDAVVPDRDGASWLAVTSLSFDISVLELFYTMARGIKVVLPSTSQRGVISGDTTRQRSDGMAFSLYYWGNDDGVGQDKYRLLLEGAKFADENGFCAIWTPERHFHGFGGPYPNPSVTGAAVASVTKRIAVRAGSCVAPLHHPARIAEEWAVVDNMTNGRAGLAFASGWQPDDFVLRPENSPPDNKQAMFETVEQVRKLWRGEPVAFARKDGSKHDVVTQPRPVSRDLPVWITTAGNPDTWREAGKAGAHVLTHLLGQSIDELAEKIGIYHQALRDAGHNPDDFTVTLMLHTCLAETREKARALAHAPMKDYLRSAAGLIKQYAWAFPAFKKPDGAKTAFDLNLSDVDEDDLDAILEFAFERYFTESGLFGTIDDALTRVDALQAIGVSEVACLIDYGIPVDQVLDSLNPLAELVQRASTTVDHADDDYSIAAMLTRHNVTHLQCTPSMARIITMDDDARAQIRGLKHLFLGGEALPGALVAELQKVTSARITNMYGPTETTIWSSAEVATADEATINIGRPIANTQLYVLDDALTPVGIGEEGELWIGGDGVTRGYWQREELTRERFQPNPFYPGRMYRTGDLVQRRGDGRLNFLGRADHQVKLRGFRIELGEIESVLQDMDGVTNAVVLAREDTPGDIRLVAYLTTTSDIPAQTLRDHAEQHLPDYMVPAHFVSLDSFPVTPNKKIDRKALPAPSKQKARPDQKPVLAPVEAKPDDTALATQVAGVWSECLGIEAIAKDGNFFDLGGHSLLAVQMHRLTRERLNLSTLSITDIFQYPTLGAFTDRIAELGGTAKSPVFASQSKVTPILPAKDRAKLRSDSIARRREMRRRRQA